MLGFQPNHGLHVRGSGVRLCDGPDIKLFILVGWGRSFLSVAWPTGVHVLFYVLVFKICWRLMYVFIFLVKLR